MFNLREIFQRKQQLAEIQREPAALVCQSCGSFDVPSPCPLCETLICPRCTGHHEYYCEQGQKAKSHGLGPTVRATSEDATPAAAVAVEITAPHAGPDLSGLLSAGANAKPATVPALPETPAPPTLDAAFVIHHNHLPDVAR